MRRIHRRRAQEIGTAFWRGSTPCARYIRRGRRSCHERSYGDLLDHAPDRPEINQPLLGRGWQGGVTWKCALAVSTIPTPTIAGHETAEQPLTVVAANYWHYAWKKTGHEPIPSSLPRPRDHSAGTKVLRYTVTSANTMIFAPSNSKSRPVSATIVSARRLPAKATLRHCNWNRAPVISVGNVRLSAAYVEGKWFIRRQSYGLA